MTTILRFDSRVYSALAIQKACYRFGDRFVFDITVSGEQIVVGATPKRRDMSDPSLNFALQDFRTEALDQNLREQIKIETEPVRNLILAHAFSRTGLI